LWARVPWYRSATEEKGFFSRSERTEAIASRLRDALAVREPHPKRPATLLDREVLPREVQIG